MKLMTTIGTLLVAGGATKVGMSITPEKVDVALTLLGAIINSILQIITLSKKGGK